MLRHVTALIGLVVLLGASSAASAGVHHRHHLTPRSYARHLVLQRWHTWQQWKALDAIIVPESGWDPCAHYPSTHDCFYRGSNACGIPQAYYCPYAWRGRLYATRFAQVRWVIRYISRRYGDPQTALYYHRYRGGY